MRLVYRISSAIVWIMLRLFSRWQVRGRENIPHGPVLVVANHMTNLDPPVLSVSLGRYAMFMAKESLFRKRWANWYLLRLGAFPVKRSVADRSALRAAEKALADGGILVIFPEGQRSPNSTLQPALSGSALIVERCGVPVMPVGISGTEQVKTGRSLLRRPRIVVRIGKPFQMDPANGRAGREKSIRFMMERIAELLPPEYRGVYGNGKQ